MNQESACVRKLRPYVALIKDFFSVAVLINSKLPSFLPISSSLHGSKRKDGEEVGWRKAEPYKENQR